MLVEMLISYPNTYNLPHAPTMKQLITKSEPIHTFVPNYIKLSEAERNWLNQQKQN